MWLRCLHIFHVKRKNKNGEVDEDKMPGLDKLLRGILQYRTAVKPDMLKQFKNVKNNPQVKFYKFVVDFDRFIAKVSVKVTANYSSCGFAYVYNNCYLSTIYLPKS